MAWTTADVENLERAVASGVLSVEYDGPPKRKVEYQSLGDMRKALAGMRAAVARQGGRKGYRLASVSKGI